MRFIYKGEFNPRYTRSHKTTYAKTDVYCPNCGKQTVWIDDCEGYYSGYTGYCLTCHKHHHNANAFYITDKATLDEIEHANITE